MNKKREFYPLQAPWLAHARFLFGIVLGVLGFGTIGTSLFPVRWGNLGIGFVELVFGAFIALGVLVALRPRREV